MTEPTLAARQLDALCSHLEEWARAHPDWAPRIRAVLCRLDHEARDLEDVGRQEARSRKAGR